MPSERVVATLTTPENATGSFVGDPVGDRVGLELEWIIPGS
jgi:hypothetical protein